MYERRDGKLPQRGPKQEPVLPVRQPLPTCSVGHLVYQPSWGLKASSLGLWGLNSIRVAFIGCCGGRGWGRGMLSFYGALVWTMNHTYPLPERLQQGSPVSF